MTNIDVGDFNKNKGRLLYSPAGGSGSSFFKRLRTLAFLVVVGAGGLYAAQLPLAGAAMAGDGLFGFSLFSKSKDKVSEAEEAWRKIRNSTDRAELDKFIKDFPNSEFTGFARQRLSELDGAPAPASTSTANTVDDAKDGNGVDAQAAAVSNPEPQAPQRTGGLADISKQPSRVKVLKSELSRVGCLPGTINGTWGDDGKKALDRFNDHASLSVKFVAPSESAIDAVKDKQFLVCPPEEETESAAVNPVPAKVKDDDDDDDKADKVKKIDRKALERKKLQQKRKALQARKKRQQALQRNKAFQKKKQYRKKQNACQRCMDEYHGYNARAAAMCQSVC